MRQTISGLVAAVAVMTASAVPAMACGGGLFQSSCSPCGYVEPCAQQVYVAPVYTGCNTGCGGWGYDRLADPVLQYGYGEPVRHQYYYADQGPTYTGPGAFAPYPTYEEGAVSGWSGGYRHHRRHYGYANTATPYYGDAGLEGPRYGYRAYHHYRTGYRYGMRPSVRYGYGVRSYAPRFYGARHSMRYGAPMGMPRTYGTREHMMRRF